DGGCAGPRSGYVPPPRDRRQRVHTGWRGRGRGRDPPWSLSSCCPLPPLDRERTRCAGPVEAERIFLNFQSKLNPKNAVGHRQSSRRNAPPRRPPGSEDSTRGFSRKESFLSWGIELGVESSEPRGPRTARGIV